MLLAAILTGPAPSAEHDFPDGVFDSEDKEENDSRDQFLAVTEP